MKTVVIFVLLAVLYCAAANEAKKEPASKDGGGNKTESSSTTASPQRMRRSPPRFDANQMKGKYAKSNKVKGLVQDFFLGTRRQERSIADYFSPTPGLLYAAQPPAHVKSLEATHSA